MAPPGELRVNAGVVWLAGNTVWSTPERIRCEVLTTMRYTNRRLPLPYILEVKQECVYQNPVRNVDELKQRMIEIWSLTNPADVIDEATEQWKCQRHIFWTFAVMYCYVGLTVNLLLSCRCRIILRFCQHNSSDTSRLLTEAPPDNSPPQDMDDIFGRLCRNNIFSWTTHHVSLFY